MKILCLLTGIVGGLLGGMGMGGGTLLIPLLTLLVGFTQKEAQAVNLVAFLPMAVSALCIHAKNGLVEWKKALPLLLTGTLFGGLGALVMRGVKNRLLSKFFGAFLLLLAVYSAYEKVTKKEEGFYAPKRPLLRKINAKKRGFTDGK